MAGCRLHAAALFVVLSLLSCGGDEFTSGSGGSGATGNGGTSSGGGNPGGGAGGALPGICPAAMPLAGSLCQKSGLLCTFGLDPRPNCRTRLECNGSSWSLVHAPQPSECGIAPTCNGAIATGVDCDTKGDECTSVDRYCACLCVTGCGSFKWRCPVPGAGCPPIVPNAGSGCSPDGTQCSYGACDTATPLSDQVVVECKNAIWEWTNTTCLSG